MQAALRGAQIVAPISIIAWAKSPARSGTYRVKAARSASA
jgi:hypothetical protein